MAKQKVIAQIYGDWKESYNKVSKLLQALQSYFPETICDLRVRLYYDGHLLVRDCSMFDKVFWIFPSCVEAFKHCKPFVFINGTHLYGRYGGVLLIAVAQDGNSNILPIAFAIADFESTESWSFFLTNLRRHVTDNRNFLSAIKAALSSDDSGWYPLRAFHAYCIKHLTANFMAHFKSAKGKRYLINAAYSSSKAGYECGRQFGHMTTNLLECINTVLKGTRYLLISAIVRITYERLQKLFVMKGREAQSQMLAGNRISQRLMVAIEKNREGIRRYVSRIVTGGPLCLLWKRCAASSIEWAPYVHPVYRHEAIFKVYEIEFPLISDESLWSEWYGTILCPNLVMRRKATGMPISTRFQNDKDEVERHEKRCGLYRQVGHTRRGCPNQPTRDA
ncbi:uncharacterized protein [Arachis hypogaea]|uniref:uncharacterized protein n=1 Tax=Arachis hypogaea TaxID=3818 RepID=UPI0007AF42B0|nr:uncharacterized protein LOC112763207 [Arachis hypogaea]